MTDSDTGIDSVARAYSQRTAMNSPYRTALLVLAFLAALIGTILLGIGTDANPTNAFAQIVWGGALSGVGVLAFVLWLTVSALVWRPKGTATPPE